MDTAELRALLSPEGLRLLDEVGGIGAQADVVRAVSRLRKAGHPPELVAAVLTQARLREKARAKFGDFAGRMLFTPAGLEQATRLRVASLHAGRYQRAGIGHVHDLGCGIGGDALALAALGIRVTAVERDEATAAVAAYNLAPFPGAEVVGADAEDIGLEDAEGLWLDPARREGARRLADPADWSPSLDVAFDLATRIPTGIKLGPGLDRDLIPEGLEAQWVSIDREVVELALWSGPLARPGVGRAALVLREGAAHEMTAPADREDAPVGPLGAWLYEPDGAVIRARLIGDLARAVEGRMLDPQIAWITADEPIDTPFAQRFRVLEELPLDPRVLKRELAARGIGTIEIKTRGVDLDPAELRRRLAPKGAGRATLVLTRRGAARIAILAERA
ncbi:class I SAM-dependent methyltransferase [Homoserinibacter sp. YIM 151385]|uniref:class I SAM-dependent methyltransferase n=1 Tax=Homoserinibacter sp. YIM 151385 TaxID=2985506 RepID=UPI0022F018F3|nr:class I SAM-dependent methyltransferase [Homoserinibacter sp. YIM 151385]WBU37719.1 class I SAM-dependent methyltransferase [Homoserinibacter sp. YIM 151385]